jgi:hypothetical protein
MRVVPKDKKIAAAKPHSHFLRTPLDRGCDTYMALV